MAILLSCLLSLFAIIPQSSGLHAHADRIPAAQRVGEDANFSIQNETTTPVGVATIVLSDNSDVYIDVSGEGTFSTTLPLGPTSASILGQSFGYGTQAWIMIDPHTAIHETWIGNIIVIDQEETN